MKKFLVCAATLGVLAFSPLTAKADMYMPQVLISVPVYTSAPPPVYQAVPSYQVVYVRETRPEPIIWFDDCDRERDHHRHHGGKYPVKWSKHDRHHDWDHDRDHDRDRDRDRDRR